jgi:hypothetical protein
MAGAKTIEALLGDLAANPEDEALRARAAEALRGAGRHREAVELLGEALVNLTAHDGPTLPCLCRRCLEPERAEAEADGMRFVRRFAVAKGRVLYYWAPEELGDDAALTRAVEARMDKRLKQARPARSGGRP